MRRLIGLFFIVFLSLSNKSLHFYGNAFNNVKANWVKRLQGMCHDEQFYYITQMDNIWKIPRTARIENIKKIINSSQTKIVKSSIPDKLRELGSNHMGDCDIHDNLIYIPLEGTKPQKMLILKTDTLKFVAALNLHSSQIKAPWVTIDPLDGTIFTGDFNVKGQVFRYKLTPDWKMDLVGHFELFNHKGEIMQLKRVQGAEIMRSRGVIWFVSDTEHSGLHAFDLESGKLIHSEKISYKTGFPYYQELEGIDIIEDWEYRFEFYSGNIFVPMLDQNLFKDKAFLKHYEF